MTTAVLVVDDDDDIRDVVRELLQDEGYEVAEARHGEEALRFLKKAKNSFVVLLDLRMPVLDGVAVINAVSKDRSLFQRHAYILATADNRTLPLSFVQLLAQLQIPVLAKPFELRRLYELVASSAERLTGT